MTDVVRIVACHTEYWVEKEALKLAQAATRADFHSCWSLGVPSGNWIANHFFKHNQVQLIFLLWQGPPEEFMLFRLAENTGLVVAHEDVDLVGEGYRQLVEASNHCQQAYQDLVLANQRALSSSDCSEQRRTLELHSSVAAILFAKLVPNIIQRMKLKV